jgi:hypothetical protein
MSALEDIAKDHGSLRYARDLIESKGQVLTRPWWEIKRNMWTSAEQDQLIAARKAAAPRKDK